MKKAILAAVVFLSHLSAFADKCYQGSVTKVYDGDTPTADLTIQMPEQTWQSSVFGDEAVYTSSLSVVLKKRALRLRDVGAPEVRGSERPEGLESRNALRSMILGKQVRVCETTDRRKRGKYGRAIVDLYFDDIHINDWLINQGHAKRVKYR